MWGYYWGFTIPQIELMAMDMPLVVYDHHKNEKNKFKKAKPLDVLRASAEWQAKYGGEKGNEKIKLDVSGFFNKEEK